ncbi:MAG TPA: hypothetical protein VGR43_03705 [Dehalococcoidia bacterium]|nr:hypothetical protein [Dehalococcoidia bacterium]
MGFLNRTKDKEEEQVIETAPCPHTSLVQRWDELGDMGKKEKATYVCDACGAKFNYEQAQQYLERPSLPALENVPH